MTMIDNLREQVLVKTQDGSSIAVGSLGGASRKSPEL